MIKKFLVGSLTTMLLLVPTLSASAKKMSESKSTASITFIPGPVEIDVANETELLIGGKIGNENIVMAGDDNNVKFTLTDHSGSGEVNKVKASFTNFVHAENNSVLELIEVRLGEESIGTGKEFKFEAEEGSEQTKVFEVSSLTFNKDNYVYEGAYIGNLNLEVVVAPNIY